ncbi:receptor-like cytosolic serine/threonine-protein kinase RBK1 [Solanum pennellii]|uniref:Receptor-like cytosolic serine/threonine-protein kinase RBK1 n=1 Tax=Solanum pennellii TaxID=28526 RepID=A0ABM1FM75_SOLPN|nr:receptor-like cytosolic serine/threonine-protein kinase RBK1 [Solanum pennellii]
MEGESVVQIPKNGGKEEIKSQEVEKEQEEVEITISSGEKNEKKENNEQLSPRAVLEISISGTSDSDNSSISSGERSRSFGSSPSPVGEKSSVSDGSGSGGGGGGGEETGQGLRFKNLFDQMKRKSIRRLSAIPLLVGYENLLAKKNIKRKLLSRIRSAEEETIDCHDFVVPKPSWRNFSLDELAQATDNFTQDNLIGKGGHAEVYKGHLQDGQVVAVKKITKKEKNDEDRVGDFLSELGIIAHINNTNAAKLIGFSVDGGLHLVLQYLHHGSLASVLHGREECLEWKIRYKVAVGVAEGLRYLHCDCQRRIIHRDITASNILLTEDYEPQISDFGLAKWLPEKWVHHIVSPIEGTFGYMAPEYFMHGIVHEKTDVFAFGVLLLELITGRRAVDSSRQSLVMSAKPLLEQNNVKELADPRLGDAYDVVEMKRAMFTASTCIHHLPNMRPNMIRAVQLLKGENLPIDMKQKSTGGRALMLDACDLEDYSSTTYLKDLNRHMQLVME